MIHFRCPVCKFALESPDSSVGSKLPCPHCGQRLQVPMPAHPLPQSEKTLDRIASVPPSLRIPVVVPALHQPVQATIGDGKYCHECGASINTKAVMCPQCGASQDARGKADGSNLVAPAREGQTGLAPILGLDVIQPQVMSRRRRALCPGCGSKEQPNRRQEVSIVGWILFFMLLLFLFWPVCWLGFFFKDTWEICRECGWRIRKVDGPTFVNPGKALPVATGCLILFLLVLPGTVAILIVFVKYVLPLLLAR